MIADLILIFAGVGGLLAASLFDLKTREVPDWLNFSLIAVGLGVRLLYSLSTSIWGYFIYGMAGALLFFLFGSLMYYGKQWGGGDVKLLAALGSLFATTPFFLAENNFPFLLVLLINLLLAGALYGLLWTVYLGIKNRKKFWSEFKKIMLKNRILRYGFLVASAMLLFATWKEGNFLSDMVVILFIVFGVTYAYLFPVIKAVENVCMYKWLTPSRLTEGDWVAKAVKVKGKIICGPNDLGLEKRQISKLIKSKIRKVLVKEGIPFVPSFLIGTVITLIFGNFLI